MQEVAGGWFVGLSVCEATTSSAFLQIEMKLRTHGEYLCPQLAELCALGPVCVVGSALVIYFGRNLKKGWVFRNLIQVNNSLHSLLLTIFRNFKPKKNAKRDIVSSAFTRSGEVPNTLSSLRHCPYRLLLTYSDIPQLTVS